MLTQELFKGLEFVSLLIRQRKNEKSPDNLNQMGEEVVENNPPWGKVYQKYVRPLDDVCEVECLVTRKKWSRCRYAGSFSELHVAVSSKESWDPSELKGEKSLLSGLIVGFSVLAEVLSRRKE